MAVNKFMDANGNIVTANNPRAVRALKKQGYTAVSSNTQPKKKVKAKNTTVAAKNREKRSQQNVARAKAKAEAEAIANAPKGTYKPGYDIKDFKDVSFKDYMRMKDNASNTTFAGAFLGTNEKMRNAAKYIEDKGMVRQGLDADDLAYIDDKVAQLNPGQTHPAVARKYNFDADGVAAADKGNTSATTTYNDGFGGTGLIRNANYPVQTVVGPTSSLDNGSGRATVQMPPKQVPKQSFDSFYKANSIDDDMAMEELPADVKPDWGANPGFHKNPGANFWTADNDSGFWQTDAGVDKARNTWGEGSLPSFVKQPEQQEIDIQAWKNFFSGN